MDNIKQGTVRATKKKNAIIKLKRQFKGYNIKLTLEKVANNKYEYLIIILDD